jgi:uncharacterized protein (TIGR00255 family)
MSANHLLPGGERVSSAEAEARHALVHSMTGFATVRRQTAFGELTLSLRTVNHRGLDLHFHQSAEIAVFENLARSLLKQHLRRGHVEIRLGLIREDDGGAVQYNPQVLAGYLRAFEQARSEYRLECLPDLNQIFTLPGVFEAGGEAKPLNDGLEKEVEQAFLACLRELNATRSHEGCELSNAMLREAKALEGSLSKIGELRAAVQESLLSRLRERMADLLAGAAIPEARVLEEAALQADRSDIQEEITRLSVHTAELRRLLAGGGEIGKRLDFLLQEMNREANTVLSKTAGAGELGLTITNLGIEIKANVERMREQALNLE